MELSKKSISRYLDKNGVTWKRLKYTAAQRNPLLRVDYLQRVEEFYDDQLVFLDESAANEFTKDRKSGWSLKGAPAIKERDFRRSERWSILPAYWQPPPYGLPPASPWPYFGTQHLLFLPFLLKGPLVSQGPRARTTCGPFLYDSRNASLFA